MQLLKYIGRIKIGMIFALSLAIYILLNLINDASSYSFFQHPYLTMVLLSGFLFLVMPFDFQNIMFSTRFTSMSKCRMKAVEWLSYFAVIYVGCLFVCFLPIGILLGDDFSLQKIGIFLFYSLLTLVTINILLVSLSAKIGTILTEIFLFFLIFAGFALNFAGELFVKINFFFYNINIAFNRILIINSLFVYIVITMIILAISLVKDKEL